MGAQCRVEEVVKQKLLILCCLISLNVAAQKTKPFRIESYRFNDAGLHASVGVGVSCVYNKTTGSDTLFVFCCSYSTKSAVVKINGRFETLRLTGGADSDVFSNSRYSARIVANTDEEGMQHGRLIIKARNTRKSVSLKVTGACSI